MDKVGMGGGAHLHGQAYRIRTAGRCDHMADGIGTWGEVGMRGAGKGTAVAVAKSPEMRAAAPVYAKGQLEEIAGIAEIGVGQAGVGAELALGETAGAACWQCRIGKGADAPGHGALRQRVVGDADIGLLQGDWIA